ncbi:hypothetical protein IC617_05880 [Neiella sp. HB171785]|uniref:Uncharacterized protein n=1 Tax=Neiella litorisoli TaxID=2771431 RepID=A0A8J6UPN5_9GAMM|nr:hypothetical protein [Neiella litorisoli]MBD1388952.1 hypothetical protein [Neiella litorisoli]
MKNRTVLAILTATIAIGTTTMIVAATDHLNGNNNAVAPAKKQSQTVTANQYQDWHYPLPVPGADWSLERWFQNYIANDQTAANSASPQQKQASDKSPQADNS